LAQESFITIRLENLTLFSEHQVDRQDKITKNIHYLPFHRFFLRLIIHACFAMLYFDFIFHSDKPSFDISELMFAIKTYICEQLLSQKITEGK
jgi:hypothetical protein